MGIVVFGAIFVDIKGYPTAQYIPGGRNVGYVVNTHGGVSRNVAEDIGNVSLHPTFVSVADRSGLSRDVIDRLKRHKVNTNYIRRTDDGLGTWLAIFDNNGEVTASISKRPDLSEIIHILEEFGDEIYADADSIAVEIDMDEEVLKPVFELAKKYDRKIFAVVSNMSIAMERRELLQQTDCVVCNLQEAEMLFTRDYDGKSTEELQQSLLRRIRHARIPSMVVTLGERGAVYADLEGNCGYVPPQKVDVIDTTGCGDAFFAGVAIGLTYGKSLHEACVIGTRMAGAVICTKESVCPRFNPAEFDLELPEQNI